MEGYCFEEGDVTPEFTRINLIYDRGPIKLSFNVAGILIDLTYEMDDRHWYGWGFNQWSDDLYSKYKLPVVTGYLQGSSLAQQLEIAAKKYATTLSEYEWIGLISEWPRLKVRDQCPTDFQIVLIDGLANKIARVIYYVRGRSGNLFYDTWWEYTPDGWLQKSSNEAILITCSDDNINKN